MTHSRAWKNHRNQEVIVLPIYLYNLPLIILMPIRPASVKNTGTTVMLTRWGIKRVHTHTNTHTYTLVPLFEVSTNSSFQISFPNSCTSKWPTHLIITFHRVSEYQTLKFAHMYDALTVEKHPKKSHLTSKLALCMIQETSYQGKVHNVV